MIYVPRKRLIVPKRSQGGFIINPYRYSSETWTQTFSTTLTTNGGIWAGGYTTRLVIPSSAVMAATKIRLTLRGGAANFTVSQAAIGIGASSGDSYDFDASPAAVTGGGSASFVIPASADIVTDPITLTIPSGRNVVFAFYATAGAGLYVTTPGGWGSYYKAGNDVTTVNTTVDGSETRLYFIRRIECVA